MRTYVRKAKSLNFSEKDNHAAPDAADMSRYTVTIGRFFKRKRTKLNLSLRDAAKEMNVSNSTLSRYETSAIDMPASAMIRLCRFYGCRVGECVADADGMIAAENIEILAQKASKAKRAKLLKERKSRQEAKRSSTTEQQEMDYICDIANAGVQLLKKIEGMDIPADYRIIMEERLSDSILEFIDTRSSNDTKKRLTAYIKTFRKHLP